jgi:hypothetical protein
VNGNCLTEPLGRVNWNTPKHLARFSFSSLPVSASNPKPEKVDISLYPPSPTAKTPFFTTTIQPFKFPPGMPFNNAWLPKYFTRLSMPPIPSALSAPAGAWNGPEEQVEAIFAAGTDQWCEFGVQFKTSKARGCWVTLHQPEQGSDDELEAKRWWPQGSGWKPWAIGLWLEQADLYVDEGLRWKE